MGIEREITDVGGSVRDVSGRSEVRGGRKRRKCGGNGARTVPGRIDILHGLRLDRDTGVVNKVALGSWREIRGQ